jgi:serine/threonine protein kinase
MSESSDGRQRLVAGRFLVLRELGRGGMGTVWLAADETLRRQVAVKELRPPDGLAGADLAAHRERALREASSAARIHHPHAVTLYEVLPANAEDDAVYLIMEYVEGPTLAELIEQEGPLPGARAASFGLQLLDVLGAAHTLGIVHRDVKPGNILIAAGDQVKLADFGIAHIAGTARLTRGGVVGTHAYMAPELFDNAPITPSADLWSLGATLYDAVEGRSPFDRDSTAAMLRAILVADLPVPRCEPHLAAAIEGLLRRDPGERASVDETRAHLRQAAEATPPPAAAPRVPRGGWDPNALTGRHTGGWPTVSRPRETPPDTRPARRSPVRWVAVAGAVLLVAAGAAAALLTTRPSPSSGTTVSGQGTTTTADSPTASPSATGAASTAANAGSGPATRQSPASPSASAVRATAPVVAPGGVGSATAAACTTGGLTATLGPFTPNTGNNDQVIDFTNVSGATCTLYGFPGVSLTTGESTADQVGAAADKTSAVPSLVTLAPGGTANAQVEVVDAGNYPSCSPAATTDLQIYPPGQTKQMYLSFATTGCRSAQVHLLMIGPVQRGEGTGGV